MISFLFDMIYLLDFVSIERRSLCKPALVIIHSKLNLMSQFAISSSGVPFRHATNRDL